MVMINQKKNDEKKFKFYAKNENMDWENLNKYKKL